MKILFRSSATAVALTALLFSSRVNAQTTSPNAFSVSLGIEPGFPTGNASNYSTNTLGGTIRLQYGISNSFALTFTTGGYHFFSKVIPGTDKRYASYGVGPVKAGVKAFLIPNIYVGAEGGVGVEVTEQGFKGGQDKLLLSPAVGYANKHWDFALHYESLTGEQNNYGLIGLRLAYAFSL
jgi:outer membrane protein assembly factor BamA